METSKITRRRVSVSGMLKKLGETISERTVGKYMKEMGIRAQWVKPWTTTTIILMIMPVSNHAILS